MGVKTEVFYIHEMSLEEFADKHGLVMEVHEREKPVNEGKRFYAHFRGVEVLKDSVLVSEYGDGSDPVIAVAKYAKMISGKVLVLDAYKPTRREIIVLKLK